VEYGRATGLATIHIVATVKKLKEYVRCGTLMDCIFGGIIDNITLHTADTSTWKMCVGVFFAVVARFNK